MAEHDADEARFARFRDDGDERSLAAILDGEWEPTFRLALAVARDPGAAEDATQLAFIRLVDAARERRPIASVRGWLRRVVVNEARTHLRSKGRRSKHEDTAAARRPETANATESSVRELTEALPEKLRLPIELHYSGGLTHAEVAQALDCPVGTVSNWIRTGLERLREELAATGLALSVDVLGSLIASSSASLTRGVSVPVPSVQALLARRVISKRWPWLRGVIQRTAIIAMPLAALVAVSAFFLSSSNQGKRDAAFVPTAPVGNAAGIGDVRSESAALAEVALAMSPSMISPSVVESGSGSRAFLPRRLGAGKETEDRMHHEDLRTFALSPDGKLLATLSPLEVRVWDTASRKLLASTTAKKGNFSSIAFSKDGAQLLTTDGPTALHFWNPRTLELERTTKHVFEGAPESLTLSPDGSQLAMISRYITAYGTGKESVFVCDSTTGEKRQVIDESDPEALAFSPDGKTLVSAFCWKWPAGHTIRFSEIARGEVIREIDTTRRDENSTDMTHLVVGFAFSRDGGTLYSAGGHEVRSWDVITGRESAKPLALPSRATAAALAEDHLTLAVGLEDGTIAVIDLAAQEVSRTIPAHKMDVIALAILPDGRTIVSGGKEGLIRFHDLATGASLDPSTEGHSGSVSLLSFSRDGGVLASGSKDGSICLWDMANGRLLHDLRQGREIGTFAFGPGGRTLLSMEDEEHDVFVWSIATGEKLETRSTGAWRETHTDQNGQVLSEFEIPILLEHSVFSRDGSFLAAFRSLPKLGIAIFDPSTMKEVVAMEGEPPGWALIAFSADGRTLAYTNRFGDTIQVDDTATGHERLRLGGGDAASRGMMDGIVFSPDGKLLASIQGDLVRLWDPATGKVVRTIDKGIVSIAFSPDGTHLAGTQPKDGSVAFVDVETGKVEQSVKMDEPPSAVAFSPDGKTLAVGGAEGGVYVIDLSTGR